MNEASVKLVCFDLGGVLIRCTQTWAEACDRAGVAPPALPDGDLKQVSAWALDHELGRCSLEAFVSAVSRISGMSQDHVRAAYQHWLIGAYDGARELLDALVRREGVRTACLSNTNDYHWSLMCSDCPERGLPIERLDFQFASHLIRQRKPEPGIYEHVERQTGTGGGAILFFDDRPENIEAAERRGWRAVRIEPEADPVGQIGGHLRQAGVLP